MGRIESHDSRAWRARAEECRAIADTFENPETRAKMLAVAADYERMAENAERREQAAAAERTSTWARGATASGRPPEDLSDR